MYPLDAVGAPDHVHDRVEAVADDAVAALDAGLPKDVDQLLGQRRSFNEICLHMLESATDTFTSPTPSGIAASSRPGLLLRYR